VYFINLTHLPTNLAEAVLLLSFTGEVIGSNPGWDKGYPEWDYP